MRVLSSRMQVIGCVGFATDGGRVFAATGMPHDTRFNKETRGLDSWTLAGGADPDGRMFEALSVAGFLVCPIDGRLYAGMSGGYFTPSLPYAVVNTADGTHTPLGLTPDVGFNLGASPDGRVLI